VPVRFRVPLACALLALLAAAVVLVPTLGSSGGHPSWLVRMAADEPMARFAREADPGFLFVPKDSHYDGVYFYAIALDPVLLGEQHEVLTQPAYRYRSPLVGWLAGALAVGQAPLVPWALLLLGVAALAIGAFLVSLLAVALGASPWLGLLVALNPGLLLAVTVVTAEPVAMAFIAGGLLAWITGRRWPAAVLLVAAALSREIGVLVAAGIGLAELAAWWRLRDDRPPFRSSTSRGGATSPHGWDPCRPSSPRTSSCRCWRPGTPSWTPPTWPSSHPWSRCSWASRWCRCSVLCSWRRWSAWSERCASGRSWTARWW
jgi:hypothetical protein